MMKYYCDICNSQYHNKSNYNRHIKSKSHIENAENAEKLSNTISNSNKCVCNKTFAHASSASRHRKTCKMINNNKDDKAKIEELTEKLTILTETVGKLAEAVTRKLK